jgi:hypothetical protein
MRKIPIRPADENPSAREEPSARVGAGFLSGLRRTARWIALHELWLLAAAGPFLLFPGRWTLPAFSVIVLTWLCRWLAVGRLTVSTPVDVAIVLIVLMALIGFYASVDTSLGLPALWRIVLGVAVFYGLVNGLGSEVQLRWLPTALILCSLALALISLIGTEWSAVRLFDLPQVYAHLPSLLRDIQDQQAFHPRIMGMALVTLLPIPLALLLFAQGKRLRLLAGLTALLVGTTVALTQSLQAAFGIACAALFLGACWNRWVLVCVPLILFASVLGLQHYGLQQAANALLSLDDPLGIAVVLRLDIWSRALAMIHDMPYTGIGLDQFAVIQTNYYTGFLLGPEPHAHNLFLQVALDLGLRLARPVARRTGRRGLVPCFRPSGYHLDRQTRLPIVAAPGRCCCAVCGSRSLRDASQLGKSGGMASPSCSSAIASAAPVPRPAGKPRRALA